MEMDQQIASSYVTTHPVIQNVEITNDKAKNPFIELVSQFENSLKSFVSLYNVEVPENRTNSEFGKKSTQAQIEVNKKIIEQQIQDVYDKAVNLEKLFLNFRLDILKKDPELLIKEEISCCKAELMRKEELLQDTKRKIASYEQTLKMVGNSLDNAVKSRTELSTHNYMPNEMGNSALFPPNSVQTNAAPPHYQ